MASKLHEARHKEIETITQLERSIVDADDDNAVIEI